MTKLEFQQYLLHEFPQENAWREFYNYIIWKSI